MSSPRHHRCARRPLRWLIIGSGLAPPLKPPRMRSDSGMRADVTKALEAKTGRVAGAHSEKVDVGSTTRSAARNDMQELTRITNAHTHQELTPAIMQKLTPASVLVC